MYFFGARQNSRPQHHERPDSKRGKQNAKCAAARSPHRALSQTLTNQSASARSQRNAHSKFPFARNSARQQQARNVDAGNGEHRCLPRPGAARVWIVHLSTGGRSGAATKLRPRLVSEYCAASLAPMVASSACACPNVTPGRSRAITPTGCAARFRMNPKVSCAYWSKNIRIIVHPHGNPTE